MHCCSLGQVSQQLGNLLCLKSSCSCTLPCFTSRDLVKCCGGTLPRRQCRSSPQRALSTWVVEHELLQATSARHATPHWASLCQVFALLFLANCTCLLYHSTRSGLVGSIYLGRSLSIWPLMSPSSLASWLLWAYTTGNWELLVFCPAGHLLRSYSFSTWACCAVKHWSILCVLRCPNVTGTLCTLVCQHSFLLSCVLLWAVWSLVCTFISGSFRAIRKQKQCRNACMPVLFSLACNYPFSVKNAHAEAKCRCIGLKVR